MNSVLDRPPRGRRTGPITDAGVCRVHIEFGVLSDQGRVRASNEDAFVVDGPNRLFLVADGMGGHAAGEVASRIAASVVHDAIDAAGAAGDAGKTLGSAVRQANARVYETQRARAEYRGMGTTLTALLFDGPRYHVAQVGDSRAYLLREGVLEQLTRDHSLVWPLYENGILSKDEIVRHPHKHLVTRSIGTHPDVEVDLRSADCREGDLYLLCSDGLTDVLGDGEIGRILAGPDASPEDSCRRLVRSANEAGGPDNITAVVVRILTGT